MKQPQILFWAVRSDGRVLVDERHDDINRTYMIRFFAEATQSPTMLLPGRHLRFAGDVPQRRVGARWVMTRGDYQPFGALRLPTVMSVSWLMPDGDFEQVRAKTIAVDFDTTAPYPAKDASTAARQMSN